MSRQPARSEGTMVDFHMKEDLGLHLINITYSQILCSVARS